MQWARDPGRLTESSSAPPGPAPRRGVFIWKGRSYFGRMDRRSLTFLTTPWTRRLARMEWITVGRWTFLAADIHAVMRTGKGQAVIHLREGPQVNLDPSESKAFLTWF